jgi:hypothetical protein
MGCVGLIDITVGNAVRLAHRSVPPRDAARALILRNARAARDIPAALVRLARTVSSCRSVLDDATPVGCLFPAERDREKGRIWIERSRC